MTSRHPQLRFIKSNSCCKINSGISGLQLSNSREPVAKLSVMLYIFPTSIKTMQHFWKLVTKDTGICRRDRWIEYLASFLTLNPVVVRTMQSSLGYISPVGRQCGFAKIGF